jgi:plasmid maintenance system killer protein
MLDRRGAVCGLIAFGLAACLMLAPLPSSAEEKEGPMLVHDVYFTLKDPSTAATQKLVDSCKKYLKDHPGVVFFAAGPRAEELTREVNDQEFHVALTVVFDSKESHDLYQDAPKHLEFIAENKESWAKVRVFDSYAE